MIRVLLAVTSLLAFSNCSTTSQSFREDGLVRAAFDLGCPKEKLKMSVMEDNSAFIGRAIGTVGVTGCGKKATYINTSNGWVKNSGG